MPIYEFEGKIPKIGKGTFVHETAAIIGDVEIGDECFIGAGAALRADFGSIRVGNQSSVQECCVMHARHKGNCTVGNNCTIGHGAILHGCTLNDHVLVGMNATVTDNVTVGENSIVGESALVRAGVTIPPGKIFAGVPAKLLGDVTSAHMQMNAAGNQVYIELTRRYLAGLKRVE
jgi:carbonic anhydrase/acetyltransferase-like protein (isoleucine patch superfamily)